MKRLTILLGLVISAAFARGDYETINIAADEKIAEYIRFDAESWDDVEGASLEGGRLIENAIWEGKHIIHSDLYIPSGVTLTINPGAQISFDDGVMLKVEDGGSLNLIGEDGNEVVIRGSDKKGIVLQSSAANYYDNNYVDIDGFNFSRFASFSISDTDAFFASGVARVPVNVSGSRNQPFSFDWVATVNGDTLVEGTMSWNNVSEGKKEIVVNFPTELKDVTEIKIQVVKARCAIAARNEAKINLSAFMTLPIETDEEIGEYIAFESEEWNLAQGGEAGRLTQNTIWEGEHIITGIVYIPSGVTLTIRPGAVIKFAAGTYIKIEDGATLNLHGEEGNDIVLKGLEKDTAFTGLVKMSSGTVNENEFVQIEGFTFGTFPRISLNNSETFRSSGLAIIPVTISGSRSSAFSFEWVAETNNVPYKTGSVRWGSTNDGTKNININFGSELDGLDSFVVRAVTNRVSYASPSSCTVKIADFDHLDIEVADNQAEYIKFSRPEGEYDGGRLCANTTWEGLHTIGSDLYIPSGVTLTISAGTIVEFTEGTMIKIEDGGALNVVGANGNDVIFKKADGIETCVGLNKMNSGSYTDNMYVQFVGVPYGGYPYVSVNPATTYREAGKVYVAFTLSGASRDQAFNLDWKTAKGQTGTVSWSRSSDGTRWAEIPVDSTTTGGTEEYAIEITAARACNPSTAKNTITILEPDFVDTTGVSMTTEITSSKSFKIDEAIKRHSIFLNEVEPVRYSGIWREHSEEAVKQQVVLESDNGRKILVEAGLGESGEIAFRPNDYPTGYYELKHEIVDRTGDALEILTKVFSVPELDDVVLHGGTITSNELWQAGKVHVVYEPISVPALYTLLIEPGAIVKFYTNSGITLQNGAALFANGIVFTHIDDDTVGGDTLSDGFTALPPMDAYYLNGDFTFGDDAELRNITQKTALSGTLSGAKMLSKGSTYRVSGNFTIANGGKLTIPAGTVLKMEAGAQITVNAGGELIANGSRPAPIVITSIRDDSISGDTNGDGDKTLPQGGDWQGVWIYGDAKFAYTTLMYAGPSSERGILQTSGSGDLEMDNCFVAHAKFDGIWNWGGTISVRNSIITDTGWAAAPYRGSKNEYINCVFYGNDVMTCYWSHWSGNPLFSNCVVVECGLGWCQTANNTYDNPPNAVRVENCLFYNPPGYSSQACSRVGSDGNIWGNPLFVDPENRDFRIREGSPCVDAANEETAPELDYYGQPRVNAPDIGICELLPRDVTSDIDLVPESVRADQEVKPGQIMFVKWTIRNAGGTVVDDTWRDTVSLVSTSGREIVLGEKMTTGIIAIGGTIFCSGYFTVPALEEGEWYPKVNVNSYHDIFEGLLSQNNALVGTDAINVKINEVTQEGVDGIVNAGMPTVLKLKIAADDPNRMIHVEVSTGVKVLYGLGFVPSASYYSGSVIAGKDGAYFRVPEDIDQVFITLESDTTTQYEIVRTDANVMINQISPQRLPSRDKMMIVISGVGLKDAKRVQLRGMLDVCDAEIIGYGDNSLTIRVDCSRFKADSYYDVAIMFESTEVVCEKAVKVDANPGKGEFWAKLIVPDAVRVGRKTICYLEYGNSGTMDVPAQIVKVELSEDSGKLSFIDSETEHGQFLCIVAAGSSETSGVICPGFSSRIPFIWKPGANESVELYYPYSDFDGAEYIAEAVAMACAKKIDTTSFELIKAAAKAIENGEDPDWANTIEPVGDHLFPKTKGDPSLYVTILNEVEDAVVAIYFNDEESTTIQAERLSDGRYLFRDLSSGLYHLNCVGSNSKTGKTIVIIEDGAPTSIEMEIFESQPLSGTVEFSGDYNEVMVFAFSSNHCAMTTIDENGKYRFEALPKDDYEIVVCTPEDSVRSRSKMMFLAAQPGYGDRLSWWNVRDEARRLLDEGKNAFVETGNMDYCLEENGPYPLCAENFNKYHLMRDTAREYRAWLNHYQFAVERYSQEKGASVAKGMTELVARIAAALTDALTKSTKGSELFSKFDELVGPYLEDNGVLAASAMAITEPGKHYRTAVSLLNEAKETYDELDFKTINPITWGDNILRLGKIVKHAYDEYREAESWLKRAKAIMATKNFTLGQLPGIIDAIEKDMPETFKGVTWFFELVDLGYDMAEKTDLTLSYILYTSKLREAMNEFYPQLERYREVFKQPWYHTKCDDEPPKPGPTDPKDWKKPDRRQSVDPNEMVGPIGVGDSETERYVKPGDWMTYTVYFENKAEATAAAQEVTVTNPLSEYLDWSTFEMGEVAFNNQIDLGLSGKQNGESVVDLKNTNYKVKSTVKLDDKDGKVDWYLRIVDPSTDTGWPDDVFAGFLPPNDETFRGEGHLTYRVKVREDAPALARIDNAATIIFDYNDPIPTDPAWWNTVAPEKLSPKFVDSELSVYEGETAEIKVFGGSTTEEMSAKLYLTHNTSSAADIQKDLKFPMTLTWAKGEIGYKTISIPTLVDKTIEDEEFFTCHIDESVITVTIKDAGFEELASKIEAGTASDAEIKTWQKLLKGKKLYARAIPSPYEGGKVSGSNAAAVGAKMSFKATANKGYAPIGWYDGDEQVTQSATYNFLMPSTNVTYVAKFMKADEDASTMTIKVGDLMTDVENLTFAATNLYVGVKVEMPIVSSAVSETTVKVAKLPAGLKYDAKLCKIIGVPTKAGEFNATFTVTTAGKVSKVFTMPITTTAMPTWAVGTFNGGYLDEADHPVGMSTLTITATGKISGKVLTDGLTWTLSATSFDSVDESGAYHATLTAKLGNVTKALTVVVDEEGVVGSGIFACLNRWKTPDLAALGKELAVLTKNGYVTDDEIVLKIAASGAVTATKTFDLGTDAKGNAVLYKASCSTTLIPMEGEDYTHIVFVYFAPNVKKGFEGFSTCLFLMLEDEAYIELAIGESIPEEGSSDFGTVTLSLGKTVNWELTAEALTATTIAAAGLPSGLKLVLDKQTKEYSIQGVPNKLTKFDSQGNAIPSLVKFTVTSEGKNSRAFTMKIVVVP